jgi:hypothetical protein
MSSQSPPGGRPPEPPDGAPLPNASSCGPGGGRAPSRPGGPLQGPGTCWHAGPAPPPHRPGTRPAPAARTRPPPVDHTPARNLRAGAPVRHLLAVTAPRGRWRSGSPGTRQPCGPHPPRTPSRSPFSLRQEEVPGRRQCPDSPVAVTPAQPPYGKLTPAPGTWQPLPLPRWIRSSAPAPHRSRPPPQQASAPRRSGAATAAERATACAGTQPQAGGRWVSRARSSVRTRLTHRTPPAQPPDPRCPGPRPVQAAHRPRPRHRPPSPSQRSDSPSGGRTHGPSRALPLGDR